MWPLIRYVSVRIVTLVLFSATSLFDMQHSPDRATLPALPVATLSTGKAVCAICSTSWLTGLKGSLGSEAAEKIHAPIRWDHARNPAYFRCSHERMAH